MERQRDWFTGINYNSNYGESEITLEEKTISQPIKVELHEKVQLIYIKGGSGRLQINGMDYPASEGCFFLSVFPPFLLHTRYPKAHPYCVC